jgi:hypothetical protein
VPLTLGWRERPDLTVEWWRAVVRAAAFAHGHLGRCKRSVKAFALKDLGSKDPQNASILLFAESGAAHQRAEHALGSRSGRSIYAGRMSVMSLIDLDRSNLV